MSCRATGHRGTIVPAAEEEKGRWSDPTEEEERKVNLRRRCRGPAASVAAALPPAGRRRQAEGGRPTSKASRQRGSTDRHGVEAEATGGRRDVGAEGPDFAAAATRGSEVGAEGPARRPWPRGRQQRGGDWGWVGGRGI
jgi:hypothetical protein